MDHRAQVLSTGHVPAEFAVPKPDANMAEASEGAEVRTKRVRLMGRNKTTKGPQQEEVCNDILCDILLDALCTSMSISRVRACNAINSCLPVDDAKERKR